MMKEAVILAGGLGTRLRAAVPDLPKCMAPVLAKPFIGYLVDYLHQQGVEKFIFCLGYKHELVSQYLNTQYAGLNIFYSIEQEPLGTGGAIRLACALSTSSASLVLNGDTFFRISLDALLSFHHRHGAACSLSLKPMKNFDRYGSVTLGQEAAIEAFNEKKFQAAGLINGGVYALNLNTFQSLPFPDVFSFENDYLEANAGTGSLYGHVQEGYFIDIGVPEDYERAQTELILNTSFYA